MQAERIEGASEGSAGGCCYLCKTAPGTYVRTFIDIDFEGEIIICEGCVGTLAKEFGYYSPRSRDNLLKQIGELKQRVDILEPKADALDLFLKAREQFVAPHVVLDTSELV